MNQQTEIEAALEGQVIFDAPTIRYYYQDGATFFMFKSESAALGEEIGQDEEISTCEYPAGIRNDCDIEGAKAAREWFIGEWCPRNNVIPKLAGE